jgi:hypothetical protein
MKDKIAAIQAQVVDIQNDSRHKGYVKVTLHVPAELGAKLTDALGWPTYTTPVPVALARLTESAKPFDPERVVVQSLNTGTNISYTRSAMPADAAPAKPANPSIAPVGGAAFKRNPLTLRAVLLSKDPLFLKYLWETERKTYTNEEAAEHIRKFCEVESRKDILPGTPAALRLDLLESVFVCWRDKDAFVET